MELFLIAIGGALGSVLRFILVQRISRLLGIIFPYGILAVNVLGCLLIGFLSVVLLNRLSLPFQWQAGI